VLHLISRFYFALFGIFGGVCWVGLVVVWVLLFVLLRGLFGGLLVVLSAVFGGFGLVCLGVGVGLLLSRVCLYIALYFRWCGLVGFCLGLSASWCSGLVCLS